MKKYNTKQRGQILEHFLSAPDKCFSARELMTLSPTVGQATVYRTLKLLEDDGVICRFRGEDGDCFKLVCPDGEGEHIHIVCKACGSMIHSDCSFIGELSRHLSLEHNFILDTSSTVIYGICSCCSVKEVL